MSGDRNGPHVYFLPFIFWTDEMVLVQLKTIRIHHRQRTNPGLSPGLSPGLEPAVTLDLHCRYYGLPYVIGQTIIFLPCDFYLISSFFPRLILAAADWMSAILPNMVWP